jgi:chromatin remodeling complex protein RSC6
MAPKTRSSAEGKRKRDVKAKEEPKTEKADHDQTKVEDEQQNDEPNAEETKGEDVREEAQEEVKEEGTHIDLGSNSQLIPRTPDQSPQDLLTPRLAPL